MTKANSNYELLRENREKALNAAQKIANAKTKTSKNIFFDGETVSSIEDLTMVIKKLDEAKDNKLGIVWSEDPTTKVRVRDARNVNPDNPLLKVDAGEKYAMQVLNQVRGGILLLEQDLSLTSANKKKAIAQLLSLADKSLIEINKFPKSILAYNNAMVNILETAGIKDAAEQLNFAKEIASFKDDHQHIVTLNTVKDNQGAAHTVIEADVMLNGLTESQKSQYTAIAASKKGSSVTLENTNMDWYNKLPEYQRNLIHDVAADIATGKKVIPTQLRELIGVRNGYEKTTAIMTGNPKKPKVLAQSLHCGAPASKNKHGGEQITEENIKQLQSFTPPGSTLNLNNLTSKTFRPRLPILNFFGIKPFKDGIRSENWISKQIAKAVKKTNKVTSSMSPINRWRVFGGGRDHKQFAKCLTSVGSHIAVIAGSKNIQKFLQRSTIMTRLDNLASKLFDYTSTETLANEELLKITNLQTGYPCGKAIATAMDARKNLNRINLLGDQQNKNLEVTAAMQYLEHQVKDGNLSDYYTQTEKRAFSITVNFCKSGKDRTGMAELKGSQIAISAELGLDEKASENALKVLGAGNHTQEMAGIQGGSVGNHSIKMSLEFGLNPADQVLEGVINQKSSGYNSEIKLGKAENREQGTKLVQEMTTKWEDKNYQPEKKTKAEAIIRANKHSATIIGPPSSSPRSVVTEEIIR